MVNKVQVFKYVVASLVGTAIGVGLSLGKDQATKYLNPPAWQQTTLERCLRADFDPGTIDPYLPSTPTIRYKDRCLVPNIDSSSGAISIDEVTVDFKAKPL